VKRYLRGMWFLCARNSAATRVLSSGYNAVQFGVSQKIELIITTDVRISNRTEYFYTG
jgi:hypothetical protein